MGPRSVLQTVVAAQRSPKPPAVARPSADPSAFSYICLAAALLFSAARITSSFWLDETATFWVVKDGLREVVSRSWQWSGQSALYYLTAWTGLRAAPYIGLEAALRAPSLLSMLLAAVLIYTVG